MSKYANETDGYNFSKTVIPVVLLEYAERNPHFLSRSQARRLCARFESFANVVLDFRSVEEIGQGFADEVFRVFARSHPDCKITYVNATKRVEWMIKHALAHKESMTGVLNEQPEKEGN